MKLTFGIIAVGGKDSQGRVDKVTIFLLLIVFITNVLVN